MPDSANLPRILKLRDILIEATNYSGCCIDIFGQSGFSDHIPGVESCKIALEYNIGWIEKHFTIDRNLPGRDNKFAILPEELQNLSDYIHMKLAMNEIKHGISASEQETRILQTGRFASDENNIYI
jgi:sialic acid synthase SpsE